MRQPMPHAPASRNAFPACEMRCGWPGLAHAVRFAKPARAKPPSTRQGHGSTHVVRHRSPAALRNGTSGAGEAVIRSIDFPCPRRRASVCAKRASAPPQQRRSNKAQRGRYAATRCDCFPGSCLRTHYRPSCRSSHVDGMAWHSPRSPSATHRTIRSPAPASPPS